ncbi:MAG: T9SS type A sorting domain-containing protein [Prevotella sp.]|nr:T9SS type A sorting domain-containing protein [Prevotella sp.]
MKIRTRFIILTTLSTIALASNVSAQTYTYQYDSRGNVVKRTRNTIRSQKFIKRNEPISKKYLTNEFVVSSNLTNGALTIHRKDGSEQEFSCQIYNEGGQRLFESKSTGRPITIDIADWHSGIYLIQLHDGKEKQTTIKIMKR